MRNILIILIVFLGVYQLNGQNNIAGYQYWFDDDYSNCVNTPVTPAKQVVIDESVPTSGLSSGIHSFHFRSFDENGLFSSTISSFFYKNLVQATAVNREIVAYEYWFDDDFDGAVTQTVTNQKNLNLITDIPADAISDGIHTFNIRVKDNTGMWTSVISSFFYKNLVQATTINREIVAYEYWFDDDFDGAVTQTVTNQKTLNLITDIPTGTISDGIHTFNIRVKDNTGMWTSVISSFFYKNLVQATTINREIVAYEYWFDDDFDNAVTQTVSNQKTLNLITDIPAAGIADGIHAFNIRIKDNTGMWTSVISSFFYKNFVRTTAVNRKIIAYRYWVDNGFDEVVTETLDTPLKSLNLVTDLDFTGVEKGEHIVHFQFQDNDEMWSIVTSDTVNKLPLPIADFSYSLQASCDSAVATFSDNSTDGDIYLWNFGDGEISEIESPEHVYYSSGTYTVVLTVTDTVTGQDSSKTEFVDITISTITSEINPTVCDTYTSPSGNYIWTSSGTYTDTVPSVSGCDSVITINLTINESSTTTITETACESYDSPSGNYTWTSSGTYNDTIPNGAGCDSVITVNLTINESTTAIITETACDSYDSPSGNYSWNVSGTYNDTIPNGAGCDSVITVNLTINESTNSEITVVIEESDFPYIFGTQTLTTAGEYTEVFLSQNGCDSTITLNLIVGDVIPPRVRCNSINIILDENGSYELNETDIAALSKGSTDNNTAAEDLVATVSPLTFNCEDVGDEVLVSVYVTDEAGNKSSRCWVLCTVTDPNELSFVPIENIEIEVEAGICETNVEYPEINTFNPFTQIEFIEGLGADGMFPLGTTIETWMAINTSGDTIEVSFEVTVITVNSSPTITLPADITIDEDSDPVSLQLSGISYGIDCMEQGIAVSVVSDNPALLTNVEVNYIDGDSVGSLEFTIAPELSGNAEVTVTVEDSEGATISETFIVTVTPVNDSPFLVRSINGAVVNAGNEISIPISSVLGVIFDDIDDDFLTIKTMLEDGSGLPTWITIADEIFTATPTIADTGSYSFVITATDAAGATSSTKFTLVVEGYPTGIDDIESGIFKVSMFPNPSKGEVTLKINSSEIVDSEVIVRSITGSEVFRKEYKAGDLIKFSLAQQVSGVYLVTLKHGNNFVIEKLILDRK